MGAKKIKVLDLFAGAGGLSIAASQAGAEVAGCLELDAIACNTLRMNSQFHGKVIEGDVAAFDGPGLRSLAGVSKREKLIIVGGAPCQPFSKAAYWTEEGKDAAYRRARARGAQVERPAKPTKVKPDVRRDLVTEFLRIVVDSGAGGFVFENVPSLKHPRNLPLYDEFVRSAKDAGFYITELRANAARYGAPQARERIFVLGSRKRFPKHPKPTHSFEDDASLPPAVTAGEALKPFRSKKYFEPEEVVDGRWAKHLEEVPPGWNYKAHTAWAGHPDPTFITETRFWNFLLKLSPKRPSWTLAASPGPWTGPFHWTNRRLRTVELAALQGFPEGYVLAGGRRDRVRQIGNAVPVPLGRAMVAAVMESME